MIFHEIEQRSAEWFALRLGKPTGSMAKAVMSKGEARSSYLSELALEIVTGEQQHFDSKSTAHGRRYEHEACQTYCYFRGVDVYHVGFIIPDFNIHIGCSPDGLIDGYGLVEIKCPEKNINHVRTITRDCVPSAYVEQVHWNIWCTDREWCDYISYSPFMPEDSRLYVKRVIRDEDYIKKLETAVDKFLTDLDKLVIQINGGELAKF